MFQEQTARRKFRMCGPDRLADFLKIKFGNPIKKRKLGGGRGGEIKKKDKGPRNFSLPDKQGFKSTGEGDVGRKNALLKITREREG